jgi:hypothetical protein
VASQDSLGVKHRHGPLVLSAGSSVRSVPRPQRPPRPFVLTERDQEILVALHQNRVLTAGLVEWAFFPRKVSSRRSPSSCVHDRVARLFEAGYVGRLRLPAPAGGGSHPQLLALDRLGVPIVAERLRVSATEVRRLAAPAKVGEAFLRHSLAISQAWAALKAATRNSEYALHRWVGEADLRSSYGHVRDPNAPHRRPIPVLPDAYFVLRRADDLARSYFLEVDLGTQVVERFRRRIRGFELYREGPFQRRFGGEAFTVLVVVDSPGRLSSLLKAASGAVAVGNQGRYLFGTTELLHPERVLKSGWTSVCRESRRLAEC